MNENFHAPINHVLALQWFFCDCSTHCFISDLEVNVIAVKLHKHYSRILIRDTTYVHIPNFQPHIVYK